MRRIIHVSHSITGPLRNWNDEEWKDAVDYITKDGGEPFVSGQELRSHFVDMLIEGHLCFAVGDCSNFDPKKGCRGHIVYHPDYGDYRHLMNFEKSKINYHPDVAF